MAQVKRATSKGGKQYLTDGVVRYDDIETKTIIAGGFDNTNGLILVRDANSNNVVTIDNDGILVESGSYKIVEDGIQNTIINLDNKINDHSFEILESSGGVDDTYSDFDFTTSSNLFMWNKSGSPRLLTNIGTGLVSEAKHASQCIVVNSINQVEQGFIAPLSTKFTISGYVARGYRTTGSPEARITIEYYDAGATLLSDESFTFDTNAGLFNWGRVAQTFTTSADEDTAFALIQVGSASADYVYWDGIQLVVGDKPCIYSPETQLWRYARGLLPS